MVEAPHMIFNAFAQFVPDHHYEGLWRSPWGQEAPSTELDTCIEIAKRCEETKFDGLFMAYMLGLFSPFGGTHTAHAEGAISFPNDGPFVLTSALIGSTERLALGFTSSLIQAHPFTFARQVSTFDRLSKGRAAWNVVTSSLGNAHRNLSFERLPTHEERYARADEYMKVVFSLWEGSWGMRAVQHDRERNVYADPSQIFRINHRGSLFSVQAPHLSEPSPQRAPLVYTAGMSQSALRLAAEHAEGVLVMTRTVEHAARLVKQLNELLREFGRRTGDVKVVQLLRFVVGSTEEEAHQKCEELLEWINPRRHLVESGGLLGMDLGHYDLDEEIVIDEAPGMNGIAGKANFKPGQKTTARLEIAKAMDIPPIVGTPEQVVDEIEKYRHAGVGGINVADYPFHRFYDDFAEQVMPVLQKRGIAQKEYAEGILREKVFNEWTFLPSRHPATKYRTAFDDAIG